jgi:hypothetical protein
MYTVLKHNTYLSDVSGIFSPFICPDLTRIILPNPGYEYVQKPALHLRDWVTWTIRGMQCSSVWSRVRARVLRSTSRLLKIWSTIRNVVSYTLWNPSRQREN